MSECQKCKKKPLDSYKLLISVTSIYLLITSIVGTVTIVKFISSLFN